MLSGQRTACLEALANLHGQLYCDVSRIDTVILTFDANNASDFTIELEQIKDSTKASMELIKALYDDIYKEAVDDNVKIKL